MFGDVRIHHPTHAEIEARLREARAMRAAALAGWLAQAGAWLAGSLRLRRRPR